MALRVPSPGDWWSRGSWRVSSMGPFLYPRRVHLIRGLQLQPTLCSCSSTLHPTSASFYHCNSVAPKLLLGSIIAFCSNQGPSSRTIQTKFKELLPHFFADRRASPSLEPSRTFPKSLKQRMCRYTQTLHLPCGHNAGTVQVRFCTRLGAEFSRIEREGPSRRSSSRVSSSMALPCVLPFVAPARCDPRPGNTQIVPDRRPCPRCVDAQAARDCARARARAAAAAAAAVRDSERGWRFDGYGGWT